MAGFIERQYFMSAKTQRGHGKRWGLATAIACALLSGCAALPGPDGTEAAIIARAETLSPLQPSDATDMKGVAHNGLISNPSVQEAASLVSASADEVRVHRAKLFPGLSLSAGGGAGGAGRGDPLVALTGAQLLYDGGNSQRAVTIADFDLQIDYITFQQAVDEAVVEVLKAYDEAQMQAELLKVYERQFAALSELETLVETRTDHGAVARTDILEARKKRSVCRVSGQRHQACAGRGARPSAAARRPAGRRKSLHRSQKLFRLWRDRRDAACAAETCARRGGR